MIRSLLSLLLILVGLPLIAASLHGDSTIITTESGRTEGFYAGIALVIAGFIVGKYWSLKWNNKGSAPAATVRQQDEPQQIDLFEPRNKA